MIQMTNRQWRLINKQDGGCWIWIGGHDSYGYGKLQHLTIRWKAHRFAYTALVGDIPAGLDLDHLCRVRDCVNPQHLEPVTRGENVTRGHQHKLLIRFGGLSEDDYALRADQPRRGVKGSNALKTHCPQGHAYSDENTILAGGSRRCAICRRDQLRSANERRRARRYFAEAS